MKFFSLVAIVGVASAVRWTDRQTGLTPVIRKTGDDITGDPCKGQPSQIKTCTDSMAAYAKNAKDAYDANVAVANPEAAKATADMAAEAALWTKTDDAGLATRTAAVNTADSSLATGSNPKA